VEIGSFIACSESPFIEKSQLNYLHFQG